MKRWDKPIDLLVTQPVSGAKSAVSLEQQLEKAGLPVSLLPGTPEVAPKIRSNKEAVSLRDKKLKLRCGIADTEMNPWDAAHFSLETVGPAASFIEPDFWQEYVTDRPGLDPREVITGKSFGHPGTGINFDPDWPPAFNAIWHLDDDHSQLRQARNAVAGNSFPIRIGHLDTGWADHFVVPAAARNNPLQRNFVEGEDPLRALDPGLKGNFKQPYHGTATLGLLAGGRIRVQTANGVFDEELGGAPFAEVVCCRIAASVILFQTSAFAYAIEYLTGLVLSSKPVQVVSMSMGGAPARAWIDAVNAAYEAGITMVTAAGNNFSSFPTRHVVYPARFRRVLAACGVTYDKAPYYTRLPDKMQGNYGPARHMAKALAAFTPNTPWANVPAQSLGFSGAGTSSATPQIAAAAALYYRKHHAALEALPEPWQRVEAIREALFASAAKTIKDGFGAYQDYFGNGILQAAAALEVPVGKRFRKAEPAELPWFPILSTIFKLRASPQQQAQMEMLNTELHQLVFDDPELQSLLGGEKRAPDKINPAKWTTFRKAILAHPGASKTLKQYLKQASIS